MSPTKVRSRSSDGLVVSIGSGLPLESTLIELSSRVQVAPPSVEIRKPTPGVPRVAVAGGGDDDRIVDDCHSAGKRVMLPMLTALLGPKSVSEIQVGPAGLVVKKSVVFHTPPLAPAA